jgi:hypothetical protein
MPLHVHFAAIGSMSQVGTSRTRIPGLFSAVTLLFTSFSLMKRCILAIARSFKLLSCRCFSCILKLSCPLILTLRLIFIKSVNSLVFAVTLAYLRLF